MRNFNSPKEFEENEDNVNTKELYCNNGLRITHSDFLYDTYVLKTDLYSIIIMQMNNVWAISIIDSSDRFFTSRFDELPQFMQSFYGDRVKKFNSAKEVNGIIKRFLGLKVFL